MSTPEQPEKELLEASEQGGNIEQKGDGEAGRADRVEISSEELEQLRLAFVRAESRRRRRALLGGVLLLGVLAVFIWLMVQHGDSGFRPEVAKGEEEVLSETNDPVCRGVIHDVTKIGEDYYEHESEIERGLASSDHEEVLRIRDFVNEQRENLSKASKKSHGAILRYPESRGELDNWFEFMDTEYGHLIRLAEARALALEPGSEGGDDAAAKKAAAASLDLQGRALLAIHESFHSFRVWHSSSLHPCGRAASEIIPEG